MAIFQSLEFDGINSLDNGIFITGEAVYNAPEREVEMISIPGRNGDFALDKGRYENIQVTYPAGAFGTDQAEFAKKLRSFRNLLASKKGYKRLVDTYNPDEYRMAIFKDAFEVDAINSSKAGEFEIVFDCKPQRYLMSGEAKLSVNSGDMIYNPTPFDASPLLEVEGYGTINIGDEGVTIQNSELGEIDVTASMEDTGVTLNTENLNTGDSIYAKESNYPHVTVDIRAAAGSNLNVTKRGSYTNGRANILKESASRTVIAISVTGASFVKGTNKTITTVIPLEITLNGTTYSDVEIRVATTYTASANTVTASVTRVNTPTATYKVTRQWARYYGNSTKTLLPHPMYIDLDIGEAYGVINDEAISFNNIVQIPAELPTLKAGTNEITFDNTVTDFKIMPRWWIV